MYAHTVTWLCVVVAVIACLAPRMAVAQPFAAVVMDARTGNILHATNHDTRLHPASLTKMMTLYVVFEAISNGEISLDTRVRVSRRASREVPSRLGLREGQQIAVRYLIRAAALRSGNDAATALAEGVSGSVEAFAARMNRTAAAIGMNNTTFRNAHGLTEAGHLSTARDMSILGRQLLFDYPQYYNLFSRRTEHAGIAEVRNTNWRFLDAYSGADGIKTGFTRAAGYNLTASAERNGVRVIVTVFGGRSVQHRHEQIVSLMNRGFREAPARAAVRRPARPDYSRQPARVAQASGAEASGAASGGTAQGRASGRVLRLQTAPARSVFPQPRPDPNVPIPEALLAAVQSTAVAARTEMAGLHPDDDPDLPDELAAEARAAGTLPARSPVPPARPAAILPAAILAQADSDAPAVDVAEALAEAEAIAAAEAAGFTVIESDELAERMADPLPGDAGSGAPADAVVAASAEPEADTGDAAAALPALAQLAPAERPADLLPVADAGTLGEPVAEHLAAVDPSVSPDADAATGLEPGNLLAAVQVESGQVVIPGLPPIPATGDPAEHAPELALEPGSESGGIMAAVAQHGSTEGGDTLHVTPDGQIIWRDNDLLRGLDALVARIESGATDPDALEGIVLTYGDAAPVPPSPVMPEIVTRVSSSGSQVWAVDLGRFGSRFDAERTLLRMALSESGTLSGGVRRVVESGGGFRGLVVSLTQTQAERACQRLSSDGQPCSVVAP